MTESDYESDIRETLDKLKLNLRLMEDEDMRKIRQLSAETLAEAWKKLIT